MNDFVRRTANRGAMGAGPDLLGLYLDEAGSFPLLTKADEMRLGQVIQTAQTAREELESRKDLTANGDGGKSGAAVWRSYEFEELMPFPEVDAVELCAASAAALEQLEAEDPMHLLAELPPDQREAVRARVLEDLDYGELAARLRVSPAVARKRVSRGLHSLRRHIQHEGVDR